MQVQDHPIARRDSPHLVLGYQLDNLRAFLFAATEQSVAAAAKKLFMTPSAVSRSIHEFEKALGVKLFERSSRGILLNSYGRIVLTRAQRIDGEIQQAIWNLMKSKAMADLPPPSTIRSILFSGRKLQLLIRLATTRKVSSSAAQMYMTQSGASMALARMEGSLGSPLFYRGRQGLRPTRAANLLVIHAKRVFAEFRHMLSDISTESGHLRGWVSIGTSPRGRALIVPGAIGTVLAKNPEVHVTMMETSFDQMILALRSGDMDAVIGVPRNENDFQGLIVEPLFTDQMTIFARVGHPLARRSQVTLAELVGERWILSRTNTPSRTVFEACCRREGLQAPSPSVESADLAVIRQLLINSDMLAFALTSQFQLEVRLGVLTMLCVPLTGMTREVALLSREGALLSSTALALLNAIRMQGRRIQVEAPRHSRVELSTQRRKHGAKQTSRIAS